MPDFYTPIKMQDVRLVCGEGRLPAWAVLDAVNTIMRQRLEKARHCATCGAILAEGPQPATTFQKEAAPESAE